MNEIWQALVTAMRLIASLDPEVVDITLRSLWISTSATVIAALGCIPLASLVHFNRFRGKRLVVSAIQSLYSVPTVIVGLFVFVLFSRAGAFGGLNLLFTPAAMVIGQALLVSPVLLGLTISALSGVDRTLQDTAVSLGASGSQTAMAMLREARFAVVAAVVLGFGRAISEVGLAIMVGGNISGFTRVITTAISLETSRGDLELSLALGTVLLFLALVINLVVNRVQQR